MSFAANGQQHNDASHSSDHVLEELHNHGGVREPQFYDESNDGNEEEMHRIELVDQRPQDEMGTQTGHFVHQDRLTEHESNDTTTESLLTPTIAEDSSDQSFLIQTIQRALDVAEPVDRESLSMSAENLALLGSADIDGCTYGVNSTETDGYTSACMDDDLIIDS